MSSEKQEFLPKEAQPMADTCASSKEDNSRSARHKRRVLGFDRTDNPTFEVFESETMKVADLLLEPDKKPRLIADVSTFFKMVASDLEKNVSGANDR